MARTPPKPHISLLCFLTLVFLVQSTLHHHSSEPNALLHITDKHLSTDQSLSSEFTETGTIPKRHILAESSQATNQSNEHKHKKKKKKTVVQWILVFLAGGLSGSGSGLMVCLVFKIARSYVRKRTKDTGLKIFSPVIKRPEDLAFLEREDVLASLPIIGRGGCGEVYKAVLPRSDEKEIAIKRITQLHGTAEELTEEEREFLNRKMRQIKSEICTVGQIRHRNLLPLLAHLARPNCHYLVYEYMKNGSLEDYLQHVANGRRELDWPARYNIALGVATGLEYLHTNNSPQIIHRDLKPANVLLDDNMEARITDFGLAETVPDSHTHLSASNVAGTIGYIAPEYYQTFQFTDKCDVYSFGVLLGVLVTGRTPSDEFFEYADEMSLVEWMRNLMSSKEPRRAINPRMLGNGYEEQMLLVLKIACFCTVENPKERPNSRDARCMLAQIEH